jgi:VanZ family protein
MLALPSDPSVAPAKPARTVGGAVSRASPVARAALLAYCVLLVYGSLSPWQGWRSLGVDVFAFLRAPWPAYVTAFDLSVNVLAYAPLGLLLVLALYPRLRGLPALALAVAAATALSVLLESLQNFLPMRIASNLDVLTNAGGALLGSIGGVALAPALIDHGRLQQARRRWFRPHTAAVLVLVMLWPLAQIHPGPMLFGNGELNRDWTNAVVGLFAARMPIFDASEFAAAEVLAAACGMLAAGSALTAIMTRRAPRLRLLLLLLAAALVTKAISYGHELGPERALAWLTPGAIAGLAVGLLAVTAAAAASARGATAVALVALLVLVITVNAVPANPYHAHWLAARQPGRLRDVAAATDWLTKAWPFVMLGVLLWSMRMRRRQLRAPRGR